MEIFMKIMRVHVAERFSRLNISKTVIKFLFVMYVNQL